MAVFLNGGRRKLSPQYNLCCLVVLYINALLFDHTAASHKGIKSATFRACRSDNLLCLITTQMIRKCVTDDVIISHHASCTRVDDLSIDVY